MVGENILNCGGSFGLQYPLIVGKIADYHAVWCRHCGIVFHVEYGRSNEWEGIAEAAASKKCRELNGLSEETDPEVIAAIDATP